MASKKQRRKHSAYRGPAGERPFWSGTITFGLVSVPVNLFPAQRRTHSSLRMLAPDGTPVSRRYYCPNENVEVHPEHIVRGYPVGEDEYVVVRDEELESLQPRKSHDIDLQRFVPREELPPLLFERAYFLTPAGDSNKAYRLLAMALEQEGKAGIATFVMRGKEYLVAILAEQGILRAETLRFEDEIRAPADVGLPEPPRVERKLQQSFEKTIGTMIHEKLPLKQMSDQSLQQLQALVERKRQQAKGKQVVSVGKRKADKQDVEEHDEHHPVDLLEAIRRQSRRTDGSSGNGSSSENSPKGNRHKSQRQNLADLSKEELYERAQEMKIAGRSKMTKKQLAAALKRA